MLQQRTPLPKQRATPRRNEGRVQHGRNKPYAVQPTAAQKRYHGALRRFHPGGPYRPCQCGCGRPGGTIHHILADMPGKVRKRDHWFVVALNGGCHNGRSDSIHLLGSEAKFLEVHGVDLLAIAAANLEAWRANNAASQN
jgi:hypothetical protein